MSYCTRQDLIDRFGEDEIVQLTDKSRLGVIDEAVLTLAIGDADGEINGWLAGRYDLPLASVPPVLVRNACDLTRYYLYGNAVPDVVAERYKNVIAFLKALGGGTVKLGLDSGNEEIASGHEPEFSSGTSAFGRDQDF
jgi:phage gp36-like protein